MHFFRTIIVLCLLTLATAGLCVDRQPEFIRKMKPVAPCAALVIAARANHIPLEQIDPPGETNALRPGDSVTALVTLCGKGGTRTQWVVCIEAAVPEPKESSNVLPEPAVLYSSFGGTFKFVSAPAPVKLRTLGPFAETAGKKKLSKPEEVKARFALDRGFLGLGLEQAASVLYRLKQTTREEGYLSISATPFRESALTRGRKMASELKVTPLEERALVACVPALLSYENIIQQTEGLKDILSELVELPSVWSMVRHGGVDPTISFEGKNLAPALASDLNWTLQSSAPLFYIPVRLGLNGVPALNITLVVTNPRPPLLACGGVIGFLAEKVDDKETYMTLRIISAKCAKPQSHLKR